jgi:hypothetical protein
MFNKAVKGKLELKEIENYSIEQEIQDLKEIIKTK